MVREVRKPEDRVSDLASLEVLQRIGDSCETVFSRSDRQGPPCAFGREGVCCRICYMGPCRITPKAPRGVCGADADTIVASARAYIHALNKLLVKRERTEPPAALSACEFNL